MSKEEIQLDGFERCDFFSESLSVQDCFVVSVFLDWIGQNRRNVMLVVFLQSGDCNSATTKPMKQTTGQLQAQYTNDLQNLIVELCHDLSKYLKYSNYLVFYAQINTGVTFTMLIPFALSEHLCIQ